MRSSLSRPNFARRETPGRRPPRRRLRLELLEDRRVLDSVTWDGEGDGRSWHDSRNWSSDVLPTASDDVVINALGNFTVIHSTGSSTIRSLTSNKLLSISGGTLRIDTESLLGGGLTMTGGTLTGAGEIIINGTSTWSGGTMSGSGVTTIEPDAVLNLGRGTLQRNFANKGHIRVVDTLTVSSPYRINNLVDATIEFTNNTGLGTFGGQASLDNSGLVLKTGGTGTTNIDAFVDNMGTIQVDTGTINLRGGSRHSGATEGRGILQLATSFGETHSTIGEPFWNVDRTRFSASTFITGGDEFVVRNRFDFESGTIAGSNITFAGPLNWTGGTMNLGGRATVAAGATATISSGTLNSLLINEGRINLTGTLSGSTPATIENTTTGTIDLQGNVGFGTFGGRARLENAGLLVKSALTGTSQLDAFIDNTGTIRVDVGTINLRGGSRIGGTNDGLGTLQLATSFGETHSTVGEPEWNVAHTRFSTNTLTVSGDQLTFPNRFDFEGGTIAGSNITFAGTLNWTGGTLAASGATIAATGIGIVSSGMLTGNLTNEGQLNLTGTLGGSQPATLTNAGTGTLDLRSNVGFGTFGGEAQLNNAGLLTKTGGTGTSNFDAFVDSTGTIRVDVGTLNLRGGSQIAGTTEGSATLQLAASFGETHTIVGNANWNVARTQFSSTTLTISGSRWFVRNQLDVESGTINGNDLLVRGMLNWSGGTMGGSGITTIERGGVLNLSGGVLTRDLQNEGRINITGTLSASNPVRIVNRETGAIDFQNNAGFGTFLGSSRLDNLGVIVKSALTGTSNVDALVTNAGTILADLGTLNFRGGLTQSAGQTVLSGGSVSAASFSLQGGELSGAGTFTGNVINAGVIRPGGVNKIGTLTIAGNYTQPTAGRLEIEIAGPAVGQFDRLAVQNVATLGGELAIDTLLGPPLGDGALLNVLTYGSRINDFASTTGLILGNGQQLLPTAGVSAYQLLVIGNAAFDAVAVRDALLDALAFLQSVLPDWGNLFDLDSFGDNLPTIPFIPIALSDLFDIGGDSDGGGLFEELLPQQLDDASTVSELISALQAAGLDVLCLWDGTLGPPACANDAIVEVRFARTFADLLANGEVDDAIVGELADAVAGLNWHGTTDWLGDVEVQLIVGIANGEAYLRGDSQLVVRVEGDETISASVDLVEILTVDANGTAAADLDVALRLSDESTRHPLPTLNVGSWSPHVDGTADLALTLTLPLLDVSGMGNWHIEIDDNAISTTPSVSYTPPAVFPPLELETLAAELGEEILGGERSSFLDELLAAFEGPSTPGSDSSLGEAFDIAQSLAEFVVDHTEVLHVADFATIESLLRGGTLSPTTELVRFAFDLGAIPLDVVDNLSFDLTSVLPFASGTTAMAAIENARLTGFLVFGADASADPFYVLTEPDTIRPDRVTSVGGGFDFVLTLDGAPLGPELVIVDDGRAVLSPTIELSFPGAASGKLRFAGGIGDMSLALDAAVELTVSADDVTIAPNSPVQVRVVDDDPNDGIPRLSGSLNLETGAFELSARRILVDFADVLHVQADLVNVAYDPSGEPTDDLLRLANLVVDLDALAVDGLTPTATLSELGMQQNGTLFVGAATVEIPDGYANALGLAGLLPLSIESLTLTFPNPDDLNQFRLDGQGRILIGTIDQQLDTLLGQDVTPVVYVGDPELIGTDNVHEIAPGDSTPLTFSLNVASLSEGIVEPIDFGPITLGLFGLEVGAATLDAQITLGGYANGAWNPSLAGFVRMTADDPANPADDQFLNVEINVLPTSTLTFDTASMALHLDAEATLAAGATGVVVDGVRALFGLEVETALFPTAPFVQVTRFEPSFESLAIQQFTFELDNILRFTANDIEFVANPLPGEPTASLNDVTVEFLAFPELAAGSLSGVALYDDPGVAGDRRVEIASAEIAVSGSIGSTGARLMDVDNLRLVLSNLVVNFDTPSFNIAAVLLTADMATLLPDAQPGGVATVTGFDALFDASGNLTVTVDRLDATIANTFVVEALGGQVRFGPDVPAEIPLFSVAQLTARIPTLGDVSFVATGVALSRQGGFSLMSAGVVSDDGLAATLGIGEFLPLDLNQVEVIFDPPPTPGGPTDFTQFALHVEGEFQFDELDLPFTPIVRVGEQTSADNPTFTFTIDVDLAAGTIRPLDFGPITLGVADFSIGEMVLAGEITLGGYAAGEFVPTIGGFLQVDLNHADSTIEDLDEDPDISGGSGVSFEGLRLDLAGEFTPAAENNGVTELFVELAADVKVRFKIGELLELYGVNFAVDVTIANDFSEGFAPTITPRLQSIGVDLLRVKIEEVFEFETTGATINISREEGEPVATLDTVGLSFPSLSGIGGEVINLDILDFGVPDFSKIEGVDLSIDASGGSLFDAAFQYVPIQVERLGAKFKDGLFHRDDEGRITGIDDATQLVLVFSGGMSSVSVDGETVWPFSANIEDLEIDIAKLAAGEFPIVSVGGFGIGIEPIELVDGFTLGGGIQFGTLDVTLDNNQVETVLYGRIFGEFAFEGIGASVELVITEYGPVAAGFAVPLAITLGQTGIMITGVKGTLQFGRTVPSISDPDELAGDEFENPIDLDFSDEATLRSFVEPAVLAGNYTWEQAFTIALAGSISHIAVVGMVSGEVTLAANVGLQDDPATSANEAGLKLLGYGDVNIIGMALAEARLFLDLTDPINPVFAAAFLAPAPSNPLSFLFPAKINIGALLDTKGFALAAAVGTRAFLERVALGTIDVAAPLFDAALDHLADRLTNNPRSALASFVRPAVENLPSPAQPAFTSSEITTALLDLLPDDTDELAASLTTVVEIATAFSAELFQALGSVLLAAQEEYQNDAGTIRQLFGLDPTAATAGFEPSVISQFGSQNTEIIADIARDALLAFVRVLKQATIDAIHEIAALSGDDTLFDPILIFRGKFTPIMFGIPMGPPLFDVELIVSKQGITFGADVSLNATISKLASLTSVGTFLTFGLPTPITDRTFAQVRLPFADDAPELVAAALVDLVEGRIPVSINPISDDWAMVLRGFIDIFGYQVADLGGMAFPAGATDLLTARIQKVYLDPDAPLNPDQFQITEQQYYDAMLEYGGILLNGGLQTPALISDPLSVLDNLLNLPDPLQNPFGYVDALFNALGEVEEQTKLQMFFPSFLHLLQLNFDTFNVEQPGDEPPVGELPIPRVGLRSGVTQAELDELLDAFFIDGVFTPKILGIELADGRLRGDRYGLSITGSIPWLAGLQAQLDLSAVDTVQTGTGPVSVGRLLNVLGPGNNLLAGLDGFEFSDQPLPELSLDVPFPAIGATISIDTERTQVGGLSEWEQVLDGLGLKIGKFTVPDINATAEFRAFSPGYDVDQLLEPHPDLLKVYGGLELNGELAIPGLIDQAAFSFAMTPPAEGQSLPHFTATASIDGLAIPQLNWNSGGTPLVTLDDFDLAIERSAAGLSLGLDGDLTLLGFAMSVDGALTITDAGVFGSIPISFNGNLGAGRGFSLTGDVSLEVNTTGATQGSIPVGGRVVVDGALVVGGFSVNGLFAIEVSGAGLRVTAVGNLDLGIMGEINANGVLQITSTGVGASIALAAGTTQSLDAGSFTIDAGFTWQVNTTALPITIALPSGGNQAIPAGPYARVRASGELSTAAFDLDGTFDLEVSNGYRILADATIDVGPWNTFDVDGFLQVNNAGIAADLLLSNNTTRSGTGYSTTGSFRYQVNTTGGNVSIAPPTGSPINIPAGANGGVYDRVRVAGSITAASWSIAGGIDVTRSGSNLILHAVGSTTIGVLGNFAVDAYMLVNTSNQIAANVQIGASNEDRGGIGYEFDAQFRLQINPTGTNVFFSVPGQGLLNVPPGPNGSPYSRLRASGSLTASQFVLAGTFDLESASGLRVLADSSLALGPLGSIAADGYLQINNNGIAASFQLNGGTAASFAGESFTLGGNVALQVNTSSQAVNVTFPGQSTFTIPAGPYVRSSITSATLELFELPILSADGATFTITADANGFDLNVGGSFTFLGNTLNVTSGHLNVEQAGASRRLTGNLTLSRPGGTFGIGGFNVGVGTSTLGLSVTSSSAEISLAGSLSIPGVPLALLGVGGSLSTNGTGSLRAKLAGSDLNSYSIGPSASGSALQVSGELALTRTANDTVYFGADNVKLHWSGFNTFNSNLEFNIDQFRVGGNGFASLDVDEIDFRIGTSSFSNQDYMKLFVDELHLLIDPAAGDYELSFNAELEVPGLFTGSDRLDLPAFKVGVSNTFSYELGDLDVQLGAFRVYNSKLVFQRQDNAFRLSVERRTPSNSVRFEIPGSNNDVDVNSFYVDTQGEFEVDLVMNQLGNSNLNVSGSRFYIRKTGRNLTTFDFRVDAGVLNLPIGKSIDLPQISIDSDGIWTGGAFAPLLDELTFGEAFRGRDDTTRDFRFEFDNGKLIFRQIDANVRLFSLPGSSSINMQNFYVDSSGAFSGTVTGNLGIDDFRADDVTLNISRQNGKLRMTLPANDPASLNLGFKSVDINGFVEMDGNFSFSATADTTITAPLSLARFDGDLSVTISDSGFSASGSGDFQIPNGVGGWNTVLTGSGSVTKGGCLVFSGTTYCGHRASINNITVTEGNSGTKDATFTVTLTPSSQFPISYPISIPVSLQSETATAGSSGDFQSTPVGGVIVNFNSGTTKTVKVRIYGDTTYEPDEYAFVKLGSTANVTIVDGRGLLTIQNDDANTASGTVSDGYINGATVFLDANRNGVLDYLDLNGNGVQDATEPDEPSAISGADGSFAMAVLPAFDLDGNGQYDANEGTIVATGGVDTSTLLPLAYPLTAPGGSISVTPLTTLLVELTEDHGLTLVEAEARVQAAFGLPAVRISETDAIAVTLEADSGGAELFGTAAQVHDTIVQTATFLAATGESSMASAAQAALGAIAALLAGMDANGPLSLADEGAIASIVSGAAATATISLDPAVTQAAATVIATANQAIAEMSVAGSAEFLADVVRIQHVAQTTIVADLALLGAGTLPPQEAIDRNTATALASQIAAAPVANIAPPRITIDAPRMSEGNANGQMMFAVRLSAPSAVPVSVTFATVDGLATVADSDFIPVAGIVEFAPGEVEKLVPITVVGDGITELDEYFLVELSNPLGGVISAAVGVGTIQDDDALDRTPPQSVVLPLDVLQCSPTFNIAVLAIDEFEESAAANSGVESIDLFVSENGGPFTFWMTLADGSTTTTFTPQPNTAYAFYSIARDRAGNIEPGPHEANATTRTGIVTPGDANCDGAVNRVDAAILALNFGRASDADWKRGDFNGDRRVDLHDLAILQQAQSARRPGDANLDGVVDRRDLAVVAKNLGRLNGAQWTDGDFNADGRVGLADLAILQANVMLEPASPSAPLAAVVTRQSSVVQPHLRRIRSLSVPLHRSQPDAVDDDRCQAQDGAPLRALRQRSYRGQEGHSRRTRFQ